MTLRTTVEPVAFDKPLLLVAVVGSTAYGLAREGSDIDRLGVYQESTADILGLNGAALLKGTLTQHEPDVTLHELSKFCSLAIAANPTVLELLFAVTYETISDVGTLLVTNRTAFLAEPTVRGAYGGYVRSQALRLGRREASEKKGFSSSLQNRTEKHGRHCKRLLLQAEQLLTTGTLTLNVGDARDALFDAGERATKDPARFIEEVKADVAALDAIKSCLPSAPNRDAVNDIIIEARKAQLLASNATLA